MADKKHAKSSVSDAAKVPRKSIILGMRIKLVEYLKVANYI